MTKFGDDGLFQASSAAIEKVIRVKESPHAAIDPSVELFECLKGSSKQQAAT